MKNYTEVKKRMLKNKAIRKSYDALNPEFQVVALLMRRRLTRHFSQRDLAAKIGTKQSAISRLESGDYNPTLSLLFKVADALDAKLKITVSAK